MNIFQEPKWNIDIDGLQLADQQAYYDGVDYSKFDHSSRLSSETQDVGEYAIPGELNIPRSIVEEQNDNSPCLVSTDYDGYLNPYQALTGQREGNSSHTYASTNQHQSMITLVLMHRVMW